MSTEEPTPNFCGLFEDGRTEIVHASDQKSAWTKLAALRGTRLIQVMPHVAGGHIVERAPNSARN